MASIEKKIINKLKKLENPKRLYRYAENELELGEEIIKDVQLGGEEDIVVIYKKEGSKGSEIKIYQGVYTGGIIIGVREKKVKEEEVSEEGVSFYKKPESDKLSMCRSYMRETTVRGEELIFFYERVEN